MKAATVSPHQPEGQTLLQCHGDDPAPDAGRNGGRLAGTAKASEGSAASAAETHRPTASRPAARSMRAISARKAQTTTTIRMVARAADVAVSPVEQSAHALDEFRDRAHPDHRAQRRPEPDPQHAPGPPPAPNARSPSAVSRAFPPEAARIRSKPMRQTANRVTGPIGRLDHLAQDEAIVDAVDHAGQFLGPDRHHRQQGPSTTAAAPSSRWRLATARATGDISALSFTAGPGLAFGSDQSPASLAAPVVGVDVSAQLEQAQVP